MNIITNEVEYCKISVKYEADADVIKAKQNEIIEKLKERNIPGFRAGHATSDAVKFHFKKEIKSTLENALAEQAVYDTITEKNIKPFGRPTFISSVLEEQTIVLAGTNPVSKYSCEFSLHTQPVFDLGIYKEFEIPKTAGILSAEELAQKMLQELREKYGQTVPYEENDFVEMGDNIIVNLTATADELPIKEYTLEGDILNVGRINIPGFSENLLGMKIGEQRDFELQMPETNTVAPGKIVKFSVNTSSGTKIKPEGLNDELAKKIGVESFEILDNNVRGMASARVKELESSAMMDQISKRLIENHDFKIPEWISTAEAQINAKNAGAEWDKMEDKDRLSAIDMAAKSIKLSLILQKIRENEPDSQLTDEETFNTLKQKLTQFSQNPEESLKELFRTGHIQILMNRIKDENTLGFIEKTCKIIE